MNLTKLLTPERLEQLTFKQLKKIKESLQKFFYTNGTNVALHEALGSSKAKKFRKKVRKALYKQILSIAEVDKISKITEKATKADKKLAILVGIFWLDFEDVLDGGTETLTSFLFWAGNQGGRAALDKMVPPSNIFELKNKEIMGRLEKRVNFLYSVLDKTGINWTAQIIEDGIKNGLTNSEIVKFLRREANRISLQRADVIMETELLTAMSAVELETFKRNGIEKHNWIVVIDEKTCEFCLANEAAGAIPVGDSFPSGAVAPPQHPRCRCYLTPVLPTVIETKIWTGE